MRTVRLFSSGSCVLLMAQAALYGVCANSRSPFPIKPPQDIRTGVFVGVVERVPSPLTRYSVIRFKVTEPFLNAVVGDFTVHLESDFYIDDTPQSNLKFVRGDSWLIEAHRSQRDQQWTTSNCLRTKPLKQADDDLQILRAWSSH